MINICHDWVILYFVTVLVGTSSFPGKKRGVSGREGEGTE